MRPQHNMTQVRVVTAVTGTSGDENWPNNNASGGNTRRSSTSVSMFSCAGGDEFVTLETIYQQSGSEGFVADREATPHPRSGKRPTETVSSPFFPFGTPESGAGGTTPFRCAVDAASVAAGVSSDNDDDDESVAAMEPDTPIARSDTFSRMSAGWHSPRPARRSRNQHSPAAPDNDVTSVVSTRRGCSLLTGAVPACESPTANEEPGLAAATPASSYSMVVDSSEFVTPMASPSWDHAEHDPTTLCFFSPACSSPSSKQNTQNYYWAGPRRKGDSTSQLLLFPPPPDFVMRPASPIAGSPRSGGVAAM